MQKSSCCCPCQQPCQHPPHQLLQLLRFVSSWLAWLLNKTLLIIRSSSCILYILLKYKELERPISQNLNPLLSSTSIYYKACSLTNSISLKKQISQLTSLSQYIFLYIKKNACRVLLSNSCGFCAKLYRLCLIRPSHQH